MSDMLSGKLHLQPDVARLMIRLIERLSGTKKSQLDDLEAAEAITEASGVVSGAEGDEQ